MMTLLRLMFEFAKTGLFSVGGGLATLPFLYEMSDATGWFTHADIADMIAISESTPGAIGINMSTYAGYTTAGVPGGILASLALGTPSVIIILIIARFLKSFRDNPLVEGAFYGLRPASIAMITAADHGRGTECGEGGPRRSRRVRGRRDQSARDLACHRVGGGRIYRTSEAEMASRDLSRDLSRDRDPVPVLILFRKN